MATVKLKRPPHQFVAKAIIATDDWRFLVLGTPADRHDFPGGKSEKVDLVAGHERNGSPAMWATLERTLWREIGEELPHLDTRDLTVHHRSFLPIVTRSAAQGYAYFVLYCPLHRLEPAISATRLSHEHAWGRLVDLPEFEGVVAHIFAGNAKLQHWVSGIWAAARAQLATYFAIQPCSSLADSMRRMKIEDDETAAARAKTLKDPAILAMSY